MASPEYPFQPPMYFAPESGIQSGVDVKIGTSDIHRANPTLPETSQNLPPMEGGSQLAPVLDDPSVVDPNSSSVQNQWAALRRSRRQMWEDTGYVPSIAGGAGDDSSEQLPDRETARRRIEEIFNTRWDRSSKAGKQNYRIALRELRLLRNLYPDVFEHVFTGGVDQIVKGKDINISTSDDADA